MNLFEIGNFDPSSGIHPVKFSPLYTPLLGMLFLSVVHPLKLPQFYVHRKNNPYSSLMHRPVFATLTDPSNNHLLHILQHIFPLLLAKKSFL